MMFIVEKNKKALFDKIDKNNRTINIIKTLNKFKIYGNINQVSVNYNHN